MKKMLHNNANIFDNALTNLFFLLSLLKISSNSSCMELDIWLKKSNIISVKSMLLFSLDKNASISLLISSNSRACVALLACVKVKNVSSILFYFILFYFFFEHCHLTLLVFFCYWREKLTLKIGGFFTFFDLKYCFLSMCLGLFFMIFGLCFTKNNYSKLEK